MSSRYVPGGNANIMLGFIHAHNAAAEPEDLTGTLVICVPWLIYRPQDVMGLFGVIMHEARHAYDFAKGIIDILENSYNVKFTKKEGK